MAEADIPAPQFSGKRIAQIPSPFEIWAAAKQYDIPPPCHPVPARAYADSRTQEVFEAWNASAAHFAQMLTESTIETPTLVKKVREMARAG